MVEECREITAIGLERMPEASFKGRVVPPKQERAVERRPVSFDGAGEVMGYVSQKRVTAAKAARTSNTV